LPPPRVAHHVPYVEGRSTAVTRPCRRGTLGLAPSARQPLVGGRHGRYVNHSARAPPDGVERSDRRAAQSVWGDGTYKICDAGTAARNKGGHQHETFANG